MTDDTQVVVDAAPAAEGSWLQEVSRKKRLRRVALGLGYGLLFALPLLAGLLATPGVEALAWLWLLVPTGLGAFYAYNSWKRTTERVYETHVVEYSSRERRKRAMPWFVACVAAVAFVWAIQAFLNDNFREYWWYVWPLLALAAPGVWRLLQKRQSRLTPEGARAKAQYAAQPVGLAPGNEIRAEALDTGLEKICTPWWVRYPIAVLIALAVYEIAKEPHFGDKSKDWIALAGGLVFIAWLTREVSVWLIGIAVVVAVGACVVSGFSAMSTPTAIIVGALIIAWAISSRRGLRRNRFLSRNNDPWIEGDAIAREAPSREQFDGNGPRKDAVGLTHSWLTLPRSGQSATRLNSERRVRQEAVFLFLGLLLRLAGKVPSSL